MKLNKSIWLLIALVGMIYSCREQQNFTEQSDAKLAFSTDTVHFDTVFTTIGSTTQSLRFYNPNDNAVKTSIRLAGGEFSNYRLNIDGFKSDYIENFEIRGKDSAFIFVEVTVDPQNANSPMVIKDSIVFYTNGNEQDVKLISFGQDVHLINGSIVESQVWKADKPYLIYNSVGIDSLNTLNIEAGAQVHFHAGSSLIVWGTLDARGTLESPIVFQGDRLESYYDDVPGQWGAYVDDSLGNRTYVGGIQFMQSSQNNVMDYTIVKNAVHGIGLYPYAGSGNSHMLQLSNSTITNMAFFGVFSFTSSMLMYNSVVANCGSHALLVNFGGLCEVYHSTIANFLSSGYAKRDVPAIGLSNYLVKDNEVTVYPLRVIFANSIIDGSLADELIVDEYKNNAVQFQYEFDHCMVQLSDTFNISNEAIFKNVMKIDSPDSLPRFLNKTLGNYHLDTLSAAKDRGLIDYALAFPLDFDGVSRTDDGAPDLGAFERVEAIVEEN